MRGQWLRALRARLAARVKRRAGDRAQAATEAHGAVSGERGPTLALRTRSVQARMNALLAGALAIGVVGAMLTWYYSRVLHEQTAGSARHGVLRPPDPVGAPPPLGVIPPPQPRTSLPEDARGPSVPSIPLAVLARWPLVHPPHPAGGPAPVRAQHVPAARERRFTGAVLIAPPVAARGGGGHALEQTAVEPLHGSTRRGMSHSRLQALLRPTRMSATRAHLLPQQRLLLAKGTFIDCTLETAIDSTLPGMTLCITSTDTFSADGTVVLLPRGTLLIGQTRGEVRQGMARVLPSL